VSWETGGGGGRGGGGGERGGGGGGGYHMMCRSFIIAVTAVTGPEFPGKRNVRLGGPVNILTSYSSTVLFLLPAKM
jgi:hypothetical protein